MHLHIVLAGPCESANGTDHIAWVSVQSIGARPFHDPTCVLNQGDHSFVSHPSWVNYRTAEIVELDRIERGINQGVLKLKEPMGYEIFQQILNGAFNSKHTPQQVKDFIEMDLSL